MGILRLGKWISVVLLVLVVAGGALFYVFNRTFYPDAPVADFPPPNDLASDSNNRRCAFMVAWIH